MQSVPHRPRFRKPRKVATAQAMQPTRHLYITGVGDAYGHTAAMLRPVVEPYGALDDASHPRGGIDIVYQKHFVYISFERVESAAACLAGLLVRDGPGSGTGSVRSIDALGGARIGLVQFAEAVDPDGQGASGAIEPEDVSTTAHVTVSGCRLWVDWITPEEEALLLQSVDVGCWEEGLKRRVQHYGFTFNYRTLMLDYMREAAGMAALPPCLALAERMQAVDGGPPPGAGAGAGAGYAETDPAAGTAQETDRGALPLTQLTVNEYLPGQGIAAHIDTHNCFGPRMFFLSLGGGVTMTLQRRSDRGVGAGAGGAWEDDTRGQGQGQGDKKHIWLPPRSLLMIEGDARYNWSHGIAARFNDKVNGRVIPRTRRVSLTFRQALAPGDLPTTSLGPSPVEVDHVFRVYDSIAVHWNHTRGKRKVHWHRVKSFLEELPAGSLLADVGSGDGKYFGLNPGVVCIGCDRSWTLLQVSKEPAMETFCCDAVSLPLRSSVFDATICIAVLHHLASKERRVATVRELVRIIRPGGRVLIQAWALEQGDESRRVFEEQDVLVPWRLQQRFFQAEPANEADGGAGADDAAAAESGMQSLPTRAALQTASATSAASAVSPEGPCQHVEEGADGQLIFQRFCHVYREGELEELCSHVPGCRVVDSGWDKGNWVIELERVVVSERVAALPRGEAMLLPTFSMRA